jgi:16S rRNA (cytosine967-C5)-methyltransferase
MRHNLPEKIIKSQSQACKLAIKNLLVKVFIEKRPADKVLSDFFRNNKQYGSRDRRLMLDISFAVFRWWGWLKKLLPRDVISQLDCQRSSIESNTDTFKLSNKHLSMLLIEACILDRLETIPKEMLSIWAKDAGIKLTSKLLSDSIDDIVQSGVRSFTELNHSALNNQNVKPSASELIPECAPGLFPSGINLNRLIACFQRRPPMWLRAQTENISDLLKKLKKLNMDAHLSDTVKGAIYINDPRINLYTLEEFRKGLFEVQDLASQAIGLVCNPSPGERWWDSCAGAGGKSLQLSFLMKGKGSVTASDIREYKLDDLKKRARRANASNIRCSSWDGKALKLKKQNNFDGVLVDAPCSCSGTWRRNPDAKWNVTLNGVKEISKIQTKVLQNAATGVKPNGVLVYATCSIFDEENQTIIDKFLKNNQNFELEPFINPLTGKKTNGTVQVFPWDGDCDATFIARFRKK